MRKAKAWQSDIETQFAVQRRMADWYFTQASTWAELVAAHEQWVGNFNYQDHWAHRFRHDERASPAEVLAWVCGHVWEETELHHAFYAMRFGRKLDKLGYVRFRRWRIYGEEGLVGRPVAVWLYQEQLTIEFAEQALAHYSVKYAPDQKHLREVFAHQLLVTQYRSPQLRRWDLGDDEWLKVVRVPQVAQRKHARVMGVQGTLPL